MEADSIVCWVWDVCAGLEKARGKPGVLKVRISLCETIPMQKSTIAIGSARKSKTRMNEKGNGF